MSFLVAEMDYGGQIAAVFLREALKVSRENLVREMRNISREYWGEDGGVQVIEYDHLDEAALSGGMGGGRPPGQSGLWVHPDLPVWAQKRILGLMKETPDSGWLVK